MPIRCLTITLLLLLPAPAVAEWQIKPFMGLTFGGATTFVDPERAVGQKNAIVGVSGGWLGEVVGLDGDFGLGPGFFQTGGRELLLESSVRTLTGSVVVALPRRMAGDGLRPYFVCGAGLMHVNILGQLGAVDVKRTLPAMNIGGGLTGFLTDRVGLSWDVRRFSTFRGEGETLGTSFGDEELSFWRATMAVAIRY